MTAKKQNKKSYCIEFDYDKPNDIVEIAEEFFNRPHIKKDLESKWGNAHFHFHIKPEESEFLKSWNGLQEDENFQRLMEEIKEELKKIKK